jgi:RIO kinase 1
VQALEDMRIPDSLAPLCDYGIVQEVVRPLMSGKEAQVYVVVSGGKPCVAKVYKEAQNRTFKHRSEYTEGRTVRNSRDQRAIEKRSKHGRAQDEAAWRSTEVDMIRRLHAAGVRVPEPQHFIDGVLIMDLITDAEGNPAPRLADMAFDPAGARVMYEQLIREVLRMLSAGVVHGDLSDFNVLVGAQGPVLIDFPQSVDTAHNANARKLLLRDVDNLHRFLLRFAPNARRLPYAEEMWALYEQNALTPDTQLTGRYRPSERRADTRAVLELIGDANRDEQKRRESLGLRGGPGDGGSSPGGPKPRRGPYPEPWQNRPAPAPRSAPSQSDTAQHRGPSPQHGSNRHPEGQEGSRKHPPGPGSSSGGAASGRPPRQGPPQHGGKRPNTPSGASSHPPGSRGPRSAPGGSRNPGPRIDVIVARRPLGPR